jgi:hypothetical protein
MRHVFILSVFCVLLTVSMLGTADAAGYVAAGKERPECPSLVARGVYPDTLNKLKEALVFPRLGFAIERLAEEIRAVLDQFGTRVALERRGQISVEPALRELQERVEEEKKPAPTHKKPVKKRRIKVPPRAL